MREMGLIKAIFLKSSDFDEKWILFKAFLNTLHSLSDTDKVAREEFRKDLTMHFSLVLRNIFHHQPKKWKFGKHDVCPTKLSMSVNQDGARFTAGLSLVIQKDTLEDPEVKRSLASKGPAQVKILEQVTTAMKTHIVVENLIGYIYEYVEAYCKQTNQYDVRYDSEERSYVLLQNNL